MRCVGRSNENRSLLKLKGLLIDHCCTAAIQHENQFPALMPMLVAGTNTKAAACYSYVHKRPSLEMSDLSIIESVFFIFFYDSLFYDYNISFTKRR